MWEMPIYAPVDGTVIACWSGMPDDDVDGDASNCPGGTTTCASGGNHLNILTEDGRLLFFGHLREDSIPWELCPIADRYLYSNNPKVCSAGGDWGGLRSGSRFDLRGIAPIPVRKGDFLGRVGTSGEGQGVHLHVHMTEYTHDGSNPCERYFLPLEFSESWYQERQVGARDTADAWVRLTADRLPIDGSSFLLFSDPLGPRTGDTTLAEGTRPKVELTSNGGVVAYRNAGGNLSVSAFDIDAAGDIDHGPIYSVVAVSEVAVARIGSDRHVVVGVRNGAGNLQLIPYHVSSTEQMTSGSGETEGEATQIALTRSPAHVGVVAAVRNGSGTISVIDYSASVSGSVVSLDREGSATSNIEVERVAIATVTNGRGRNESAGAFSGVVTVERRHDDRLVVRSWSVGAGGAVNLVDGELAAIGGQAFGVEAVDIAVVGDGNREFVVTSARRMSTDELVVHTWEIRSNGTLTQIDSHVAGVVGPIAIAEGGSHDALTAVRDEADGLSLLSWSVQRDAPRGELRRAGKRVFGVIDEVDVAARPSQGDAVVAITDSDQNVKLIRLETNYTSDL